MFNPVIFLAEKHFDMVNYFFKNTYQPIYEYYYKKIDALDNKSLIALNDISAEHGEDHSYISNLSVYFAMLISSAFTLILMLAGLTMSRIDLMFTIKADEISSQKNSIESIELGDKLINLVNEIFTDMIPVLTSPIKFIVILFLLAVALITLYHYFTKSKILQHNITKQIISKRISEGLLDMSYSYLNSEPIKQNTSQTHRILPTKTLIPRRFRKTKYNL